MAQWLVRWTAERLGGSAVGSIPTVGVCQLTAIFQQQIHWAIQRHRGSATLAFKD